MLQYRSNIDSIFTQPNTTVSQHSPKTATTVAMELRAAYAIHASDATNKQTNWVVFVFTNNWATILHLSVCCWYWLLVIYGCWLLMVVGY